MAKRKDRREIYYPATGALGGAVLGGIAAPAGYFAGSWARRARRSQKVTREQVYNRIIGTPQAQSILRGTNQKVKSALRKRVASAARRATPFREEFKRAAGHDFRRERAAKVYGKRTKVFRGAKIASLIGIPIGALAGEYVARRVLRRKKKKR